MGEQHSTKHIIQSLLVNCAIAAAKGVAAVVTGSGAMLAETLHSVADCGNQLLLLLGVKSAKKPPDESHPLGYGRSLYFWSFLVALLLFSGGGVFSVYEGFHKLSHPEPVTNVTVGLVVLLVSLALTKDARFDAYGSIAIGVVLVLVAVFLAVEIKSLLVGERADPEIEQAARDVVREHPRIESLINVITVQQGPGEVLVAMKVLLAPMVDAHDVVGAINDFEVALRKRRPDVKWLFVEPDVPEAEPTQAA